MIRETAVFFINSLQHGGAERVVVNQAEEMHSRGYLVYIILLHDCIAYEISDGIRIKTLGEKCSGAISKLTHIPIYAYKLDALLEKIMRENKVILLTSNLPYAHYVCRFSKNRKKFLYVMHNPQFHFKYSKAYWFKKRINFLLSDVEVVGVSKGVVDELCDDYDLNRKNVHLIYNPLDFKMIDDCLNKAADNPLPQYDYLLFVGRLTPQKNIFRLLDAYGKSKANGVIKLILIGVGELQEELAAYVKKIKIENKVVFLGWENNVFRWMSKAKGLICSSDYESFGMVIGEALYCNCPVVSTNCKFGPSEILVNEFSRYLSDLNSDSLAEKINYLLEENYPLNKRGLVSKFAVEEIMNKYIDLYKIKDNKNE